MKHPSSLLGRAGQVVDHMLAAQGHDLMRHAYKHMEKAHANWSGDTAYFHAAHAFHAGQVQSHRQAAWHQVGQAFRPSPATHAGPGPMFNPGWLAQAATLPTVRQALHAAVDMIQRLFRR